VNANIVYTNHPLIKGTYELLKLPKLTSAIPFVLNDIVNTLKPLANKKNQTLKCYADTYLNRLYLADTVSLGGVLSNFIWNAMTFIPEKGEIIVRAQLIERIDTNERIRFSVKDNTIGISDEIQVVVAQPHPIQNNVQTTRPTQAFKSTLLATSHNPTPS
jgi:signal transduction histidine kinase